MRGAEYRGHQTHILINYIVDKIVSLMPIYRGCYKAHFGFIYKCIERVNSITFFFLYEKLILYKKLKKIDFIKSISTNQVLINNNANLHN